MRKGFNDGSFYNNPSRMKVQNSNKSKTDEPNPESDVVKEMPWWLKKKKKKKRVDDSKGAAGRAKTNQDRRILGIAKVSEEENNAIFSALEKLNEPPSSASSEPPENLPVLPVNETSGFNKKLVSRQESEEITDLYSRMVTGAGGMEEKKLEGHFVQKNKHPLEKKDDTYNKIEELKQKMEESKRLYAQKAGEMDGARSIFKTLLSVSSEVTEEVSLLRQKWIHDKLIYEDALIEKLFENYDLGLIDEETINIEISRIRARSLKEEITDLYKMRFEARNEYAKKRKWMSEYVESAFNKIADFWKKTPTWCRFAVSISLGLAGGAYTTPAYWLIRVIGGGMAGKATQEKLQQIAENWRKMNVEKQLQKEQSKYEALGLSTKQKLEATRNFLRKNNLELDSKLKSQGKWDMYRRWAGVVVAGIIGSGTLSNLYKKFMDIFFDFGFSGTQVGSSAGTGIADLHGGNGAFSADQLYGEGIQDQLDSGSANSGQTGEEGAAKEATPESSSSSVNKEPGVSNDVVENKLAEWSQACIIEEGSSIEGSTAKVIIENPDKFGLDPSDPKLVKNAKRLASRIVSKYAESLGIDYQELDEIARAKVRPGDRITIFKNLLTGEFELNYDGAARDLIKK